MDNVLESDSSSCPAVRATPLRALEREHVATQDHFVRDHYPPPAEGWSTPGIEVGGAVGRPGRVSVAELHALPRRRRDVVLECAGHRRNELEPKPPGLPWGVGAVAEARWGGVSLATLLEAAGVDGDAVEVLLEGADQGPFPDAAGEHRFARSLPLDKALHPDTLVAIEMNGEPIALERGGPVRVIVPGWYATDSVKWLCRIAVLREPFEGPWQQLDYRMIRPGLPPEGERMSQLPVHALLTAPTTGEVVDAGRSEGLRGVAWGGKGGIAAVEVNLDGTGWRCAALHPPRGTYARTFWRLAGELEPGRHTVRVRATDHSGRCQPDEPTWNARGFANHSVHRVEFSVAPLPGGREARRRFARLA